MGKMLIIIAVAFTSIFSSIIMGVMDKTGEIPTIVSEKLAENELDEIGSYALNYAIKYFDSNFDGTSETFSISNWNTINLQDGSGGSINNINYNYDNVNEEWTVKAIVSASLQGQTITDTTKAIIDYRFDKPESEVAGWDFDEGTGDTAGDETGGGSDATLEPPPGKRWVEGWGGGHWEETGMSWSNGQFDDGANSDAINEHVDAGTNSNQFLNTGTFTVTGWTKIDPGLLAWTANNIISNVDGSGNVNYTLYHLTRKFLIYTKMIWVFGVGTYTGNEEKVDVDKEYWFGGEDAWHFVVATYDENASGLPPNKARITIEVRNREEGWVLTESRIIDKWAPPESGDLTYMGGFPNEINDNILEWIGNFFDFIGSWIDPSSHTFDEIGVYDDILDPQEIQDLYDYNGVKLTNIRSWY